VKDEPCTCTEPGFCPRFQIGQTQYALEVCQDKHGAEKGAAYRRKWGLKVVSTGTATRRPTATTTPAAPVPVKVPKKTAPIVPGISVRVKKRGCRKECQWAWTVLLDGVVRENGHADTKELAEAAADAEAKELAALLGLPYSGVA
jgi:hypothetical protein